MTASDKLREASAVLKNTQTRLGQTTSDPKWLNDSIARIATLVDEAVAEVPADNGFIDTFDNAFDKMLVGVDAVAMEIFARRMAQNSDGPMREIARHSIQAAKAFMVELNESKNSESG